MQSTHMASKQITEEAVYLCTGNPLPKDIEQISYWLLNEPFSYSFQSIQQTLLLNLNVYKTFIHPFIHLFCFYFSTSLFCFFGWFLTLYRNIWYQGNQRIGFSGHCKRSNYVSLVLMASKLLLLILQFILQEQFVFSGSFLGSRCLQMLEYSSSMTWLMSSM